MTIPIRRVISYSVAGLSLFGVLVSAYVWWSTRIDRFPGLKERFMEYYTLETKHQWGDTYTFRVPAFRNTVPRALYVSGMEKDARDWALQSVNVIYAIPEKNRVKVAIQFKEVAPKGYFRTPKPDEFSGLSVSERSEVARVDAIYKDKAIEITYTDWSVWENIDGVWYAWETGTRSHMSLNAGIAVPDR